MLCRFGNRADWKMITCYCFFVLHISVPTRVVLDLNVNTMITIIILFAMKLAKTQRVVKCFPKQIFWLLNIKQHVEYSQAFKLKEDQEETDVGTSYLELYTYAWKREETKRIYKAIRNDVLNVVEYFEFYGSNIEIYEI